MSSKLLSNKKHNECNEDHSSHFTAKPCGLEEAAYFLTYPDPPVPKTTLYQPFSIFCKPSPTKIWLVLLSTTSLQNDGWAHCSIDWEQEEPYEPTGPIPAAGRLCEVLLA